MGRRGPAPTPTNVLAARGSWRAKARKDSEPPKVEGKPSKPKWLTGDAAAMWRSLVKWLDGMGVLAKSDQTAMARYCQYWAQWVKDTQVIRDKGATTITVDKAGEAVEINRVEFNRQLKLGEQLDKLEKQFGLTPASRAGIANAAMGKRDEPKLSPAQQFLRDNG